jgi:sterol desaturase/sphingolipid hydroxylase (fatty acid hydroxylase superfamily)
MGNGGLKHDETSRPLVFGEGRISGYLSITLGVLSILGVACFLFPDLLTTPSLRAGYDLTVLRWVLAVGMAFSVGFGLATFFLGRNRRLGALGISLTLLAMLMGGPTVPVGARYDTAGIFLGLDWFVLDLLISAVVFVFLEKVAPLLRDQAVLRPDFWHDARYFAFNHLAIGIFLYATVVLVPGLFSWTINEGLQAWFRGQWGVVQFLIILVCADVVEYWIHRTMHEVPWLWRIHAVHHSAEHMDWLAGSRLHILEPLATRMLVMLPAFILGAEGAPLLCYIVFAGFQAGLAHANFGVDFGPLKYVFNTPQFHHWHHSSEREAVDRNYAAHLPVIDKLFGTYYMPPDQWPAKYGVIGDPLPKGMVRQFFYPFTRRRT